MDYTDLIGKPFEHMGRGPNSYDCWGCVLEVLRRAGKIVIDPVGEHPENWADDKDHNYFLENYYKQWEKVKDINDIKILDVILLGDDPNYPTHIGIVIERNRFLHCGKDYGVVSSKISRITPNRITGFYRLKI